MEASSLKGLDWGVLNKQADEVRDFLAALDETKIGDGRMAYQSKDAILVPRSTWGSSSRVVQWLSTIGCDTATFEHTRSAFADLVAKVKDIYQEVIKFPCQGIEKHTEALDFWYKLTDLVNLIEGVSERGVSKLCDNYRRLNKIEEATAISNLAKEAFSCIRRSGEHLFEVLNPIYPHIKEDGDVKRFYRNSQSFLLDYERFRKNLRAVTYDKDKGLRIPQSLIQNCVEQIRAKGDCRADSLKVAARQLKIPGKAVPIPGLQPKIFWNPSRILKTPNRELIEESGVIGSCEQLDGLCNVYFLDIPNSNETMITCSSIDTDLKVDTLRKIMDTQSRKSPNRNWVIHHLNSFSINPDAFTRTQNKISRKLPDSVLQMGTCFNYNSSDKAEERFFTEINLFNLMKIALMICEEAKSHKDLFQVVRPFEETAQSVKFHLGRITELKNETDEILERNHRIEISRLDKSMPLMNLALTDIVNKLENKNQKPAYLKRALLLFRLLDDIIKKHLDPNKNLSATSLIERYIMLYRMLNLNPIFICETGLDSSGPVRALVEGQYFFEELIFKACRENRQSNEELEEDVIEAKEQVYCLLKNIDELKPTLYRLTTKIINDLQFPILKDLNDTKTQTQALAAQKALLGENREFKNDHGKTIPVNLRNVILEELKQEVGNEKITDYYRAQVYLEMVFGALLLDQEKPFNDSGAFGFQFGYDETAWWWKKPKNPHPIERWPLFVLNDQNVPIQILECHDLGTVGKWFYDPITPTQAGVDLTHRVNQLRAK